MRRLFIVLSATLLLLGTTTAATSADETEEDGLDARAVATRERLARIASAIVDVDVAGAIATTSIDPATTSVSVHIVGNVPAAMRQLIESAPSDVRVKVISAKYSMSRMQAAGRNIHRSVAAGTVPMYSAIVSNNDGSGLTVEVDQKVLGSDSREALEAKFSTAAGGLPVRVVEGEAPVALSRPNDADPWRGGMQMRNSGGICSTAFAVLRPGGYGRILSASHCDFYGNDAWDDYVGDTFTLGGADVAVDRVPYDTMIIDPVGGTQGRVYGGPWNATSSHERYSLKVAAADGSHVGDYICTSGANSGEHCNIVVQELGVQWSCGINNAPPPAEQCAGHRARRTTSAPAAVSGDSGGPIYRTRSDGRVTALGVIYGGSESVACGSTRVPPSFCARTLLYPAVRPILERWDATIETTP